jgi:Trk-type K+ transport system membrane component
MYVRKYTKTQVHQTMSAKMRNRHPHKREVALQYRELVVALQTKLHALRKLNFFKHFSFHGTYSLCVLTWGLMGALLLCDADGFAFVDGLLLSVSAFCEAGLSPISMLNISKQGFIILAVLVFFGNTIMMLVYPLLARTYYFRKVLRNITAVDKSVLDEYRLWHEGTVIFIFVLLAYMLVSISIGVAVLYVALQLHPAEPETAERGFSPLAIAAFHALSAFANAGFTLSSQQVVYYKNNPLYYTTLSFLILLGNTASPIMLRWLLTGLYHFLTMLKHRFHWQSTRLNAHAIKYVLDNPRRITTNLFSPKETSFLGYVLVGINVLQYVLYLASTLNRNEALAEDSKMRLAAIGTFQTVVTRTAGFQIVDLRTVNQGMLVVYALAMYLSAAPFLSAMYLTEDNVESVSQLSAVASDSDSDSEDELDERFRAPVLKRSETKSLAMSIKNNFMTKHVYYLMFAVVLLAFTEDGILSHRAAEVNLWYILFEVASAYGTVGLSLGLPGSSFSLVGTFTPMGKLIITAVIFLGKHRGLPLPTDAVIDFKFNRLKRASRRKARAANSMSDKSTKVSMMQTIKDSVSHRVQTLSPRTPKKPESKGIAILELKSREKRKTGMSQKNHSQNNINSQSAINRSNKVVAGVGLNRVGSEGSALRAGPPAPGLLRVGSYHDVNPNLPLKRVGSYHERNVGQVVPSSGESSPNANASMDGSGVGMGMVQARQHAHSPSRQSMRRRSIADMGDLDVLPVADKSLGGAVESYLSKIAAGITDDDEESVQPFVYSPRGNRSKKVALDRMNSREPGSELDSFEPLPRSGSNTLALKPIIVPPLSIELALPTEATQEDADAAAAGAAAAAAVAAEASGAEHQDRPLLRIESYEV